MAKSVSLSTPQRLRTRKTWKFAGNFSGFRRNFAENSTHLAKGALAEHGEEVELLGIGLRHGRREHGRQLELHLGVTGAFGVARRSFGVRVRAAGCAVVQLARHRGQMAHLIFEMSAISHVS